MLAKHLPYKREGATNIFEIYTGTDRSEDYNERLMRILLMPVDAESPRATLTGFLDSVNRAYSLVMETNAALRADPPQITRSEALEAENVFAVPYASRNPIARRCCTVSRAG